MEVHDPPNRIRYREIVVTSVAGQIEFLSSYPTVGLQKLNFSVADHARFVSSQSTPCAIANVTVI